MKIIISVLSDELFDEFTLAFQNDESVSIYLGEFQTIPKYDCMVSAANSFGLMDGGVDFAITDYFGVDLMLRVQEHIKQEYRGEQLVGSAFVIETKHKKHPYLVHAPTMRIPEIIDGTDAVYRATWAALIAIDQFNKSTNQKINTVVFPAMGAGCGQVTPKRVAQQMALAWRNVNNVPTNINWVYAQQRYVAVVNAAVQ